MRNRSRLLSFAASAAFAGSLIAALVLFQNCGGFSTGLGMSSLSSLNIRADGCAQGAKLFSGACRKVNSVALSGASVTTKTFPDFEKFVYSVNIPGSVNFTGMTGTVALDSNSPSFTEALYTIGYSPSGSCPASGTRFPDYDSVFATMPDNKFLNQYIIKAQGGHVEMPAVYDAAYPIAVSGCFFVVLDGSAGNAGTSDTMTVDLHMNFVGGDSATSNVMLGLTNYEHFASPGHPFSSTNQYLEVNKISRPIHVSALIGSLSNAAFDFFSLNPPTGDWNTHNVIYLVRQCTGYQVGNFQDQDFFSQVPAKAITLVDYSGSSNGRGVVQTSLNQPLDLDLHAGDCIVHIIAGNANGNLDFEDALAFNGSQGSNHPVMGNIDGISQGDINGWACQQGVADSINVELYLGGVDYGTYSASQASEPAVAQMCGSTGTAYRFSIEIAGDIATNYAGKPVIIYGLSSNVANNNALNNSAVYKIPTTASAASAAAASTTTTLSAADQAAIAAAAASAQAQAAAAAAAAQQQSAAAATATAAAASAAQQAAAAASTAASPSASQSAASDAAAQQAAAAAAAAQQAAAAQAAQDAAAAATQQAADAAAFNARAKATVNRYVGSKGHLFARDGASVAAGFSLEGAAFSVYTNQYANTAQLYRCSVGGHQMLSLDANCEGQTVLGTVGWISTVAVKGSSPLYRLRNAAGDYIEANDQSVTADGYVLDGQMGWTP